ncbi:unnamed protein product [Adineta ricciae]|uniref:Uncharacterized protein n=1 Tax=Adineta ricciae TaxID=249248 RepID=A0A814P3P2_ADIRI|nr:unnamed protein product [Adineta ricciae]
MSCFTADSYRENLALRHPCNSINKRLQPYITWTEKLASSQYKVQKDACGQLSSGPACCTHEIMNTYALSYGTELQKLIDAEFDRFTRSLFLSKEQIDIWSKEYITELRRLTISSLETLFGTKEYRSNVHQSVLSLFNTLSNNQSSVDDVSKATIDLFNQLIISLYRQFMVDNKELVLDAKLKKCLVNKAFEIDALSSQRELLYILTSGSSLLQLFRTMIVYIHADIRRITSLPTMTSNSCIQRYARETLCPLCVNISRFNQMINDNNEPLCEGDCRYATETCFNQTNGSYMEFATVFKNYSLIVRDIEQTIVDLKLVERLSKLHIYLYDMVVKAINSRQIYTQLQKACSDPNAKSFSPLLSLPPTISERRELVYQWNRSLHFVLKQLQSSIDTLHIHLTEKIITDICSNSNYAVKSNRCTQIDKQNAKTVSSHVRARKRIVQTILFLYDAVNAIDSSADVPCIKLENHQGIYNL